MRIVPALGLLLCAVALRAQATLEAPGAPWPLGRGDAQNTGRLPAWAARSAPGGIAPWRFPTTGPVSAPPVIDADERIYAATVDGWVFAFDPVRGREMWRVPAAGPVFMAAALAGDGSLYVAGGAVLAALRADGASRWVHDRRLERPPPLPGTRRLWRGSVSLGSLGGPCAGADDFLFLCLDASGAVRWTRRFGLPVGGPAAAGDDGAVYVPALDMRLYALDAARGSVRWHADLGAPVTSAVVGRRERTVYAAATDGGVHALDAGTGAVRWSSNAGGPILASAPALSEDGVLYVATTEGTLLALDATSGRRRWLVRFSNPFRSSPAVGPDPEGIADHLVYIGGGDGRLHALGPDGRTRWVYDTVEETPGVRPVGLDGGPALGQRGLAVGSAAGAVYYVPYDYYLRSDAVAIRRGAAEGEEWASPGWRMVSPAGTVSGGSLAATDTAAEAVPVGRADVVTVRAGPVDAVTGRAPILPDDVLEVRGVRETHRVVRFGDGRTIGLVPRSILPSGALLPVSLAAREHAREGPEVAYEGRMVLQAGPESVDNPIALRLHRAFRVARPLVTQPPAVAALLTGLPATGLRLAVVDTLPARRAFVAWGVQETPVPAGDEPEDRGLVFAFAGRWHGDAVVLEATDAVADLGGLAVPVDRLRLAGRFVPGGRLAPGTTLLAEVRPPGLLGLLDTQMADGRRYGPPATWLGEAWARGRLLEVVPALWRTIPAVARFVSRRPWEALGMVNADGEIVVAGTFEMTALPAGESVPPPVRVRSFVADVEAGRAVAEIRPDPAGDGAQWPVLSMLLVDPRTGAPVPLDYNRAVRRDRLPDGAVRLTLPLPAGSTGGREVLRAHVMADLATVATVAVE